MNYDRKFLIWALGYAVFGMSVGIYMAASGNHVQHPAHAHILLVGFVVSLIYAVIHKLWLGGGAKHLAMIQFVVHHAGALVMFAGLLMLFGNVYPPQKLEPILAASSITVLAGMLLMLFMVIKSGSARA
jgi:hypothetical protein